MSKRKCPEWMKFLRNKFSGELKSWWNIATIDWLILYWRNCEKIMVFLIGEVPTENNFYQYHLRTYGLIMEDKRSRYLLSKKKETGANNDMLGWLGPRFVSVIESEDGEQLSENIWSSKYRWWACISKVLKTKFFRSYLNFKVFFTTNHEAGIKSVDEGDWRRFRLIHQSYSYLKKNVIRNCQKTKSWKARHY